MSELDADQTPDGIDLGSGKPSVRHVNKWPLIIGMGFFIAVLGMFAYSVGERAKPIEGDQAEEASTRTTDLTGPKRFLDEQPDIITPVYDPEPLDVNKLAASGAGQGDAVAGSDPVVAPAPPMPQRKDPLEQERERYRQNQLSAYYGALDAPMDVGFDKAGAGGGASALAALTNGLPSHRAESGGGGGLDALRMAAMSAAAGGGEADQNKQVRKETFLREDDLDGAVRGRQAPVTDFEVKTGTVIPAVMLTGLNSDLPGEIIAQVSQHVYDTATGRHVLIPQGSKLTGRYDSQVAYGQERILVVWDRLVYPDGSTVELGRMAGADQAGYGGFADQVNNHYVRVFGSAVLMSLISAGYGIAADDGNSATTSAAQSASSAVAQQLAQTTDRILRKNLNIQPTIEVRPGYVFNVIVNKDMRFLEPFQG